MDKDVNMERIEQISLGNGLLLEVEELSRPIADGTTRVEILFRTEVPLDPGEWDCPAHLEALRKVFGDPLRFEFRAVRSFVRHADAGTVSQGLRDAFRRDSFAYLCRSDFPRRFALSKYREILKHPERYGELLKEP